MSQSHDGTGEGYLSTFLVFDMSPPALQACQSRLRNADRSIRPVQYIYYGALQRHRDRIYTRRLLRQQRHLHYMHSGSDAESPLAAALVSRSSDEVRSHASLPGWLPRMQNWHMLTSLASLAAGGRAWWQQQWRACPGQRQQATCWPQQARHCLQVSSKPLADGLGQSHG